MSKAGPEGESLGQTFRAVAADGRVLNYRTGEDLNPYEVAMFFVEKYSVRQIWNEKRHVVGVLEKSGISYFLKVAKSEGIGLVTKNEYDWNDEFNKAVPRSSSRFWVPQNHESGFFHGNLFYFTADKFEGSKLVDYPKTTEDKDLRLEESLEDVVEFSELIQSLNPHLNPPHLFPGEDYREIFLSRARGWYNDLHQETRERYGVDELWRVVNEGVVMLKQRASHGDFTPWHLFDLGQGRLGLIDGEHARANAVEEYDMGYFIQRVFTVMGNQDLAEKFMESLGNRGHDLKKVKVLLAARGIGGFLDAQIGIFSDPNAFNQPLKFKNWVLSL